MAYSPWGRKESDRTEQLHFPYLRAGVGLGRSTHHRIARITQGCLSFPCTHKHLLFHSQDLAHPTCRPLS